MDRKNNKNKIVKRIAMVLLCILIPVGAFGFGYFFKNVEGNKDVTHTLTVDGSIKGIDSQNIECDTDGIVPGDSVNVPISIQPNSTTESLLRVKVKPYWMSKDGTESDLSNKNLKVIDVNVSDTIIDNEWFKEGEYYYYIGQVKDENEIALIKGVKFEVLNNEDSSYDVNKYQDKKIGIKIDMEIIQCRGKAYSVKWNASNTKLSSELDSKLSTFCDESKTIN